MNNMMLYDGDDSMMMHDSMMMYDVLMLYVSMYDELSLLLL